MQQWFKTGDSIIEIYGCVCVCVVYILLPSLQMKITRRSNSKRATKLNINKNKNKTKIKRISDHQLFCFPHRVGKTGRRREGRGG